jgi:hypothetical protein
LLFEEHEDSTEITLVFMQENIPVFKGFYFKLRVIHRIPE